MTANSAHIKQSKPDYGLDFQVKVLETSKSVSSLLRSGCRV